MFCFQAAGLHLGSKQAYGVSQGLLPFRRWLRPKSYRSRLGASLEFTSVIKTYQDYIEAQLYANINFILLQTLRQLVVCICQIHLFSETFVPLNAMLMVTGRPSLDLGNHRPRPTQNNSLCLHSIAIGIGKLLVFYLCVFREILLKN